MAKTTLSITVKTATITVPDRTARVQKARTDPTEIVHTQIIRQTKPGN